MTAKSSFYVTTPIYYVNDEPHIGHAYTTVLADVLARFHRLHGRRDLLPDRASTSTARRSRRRRAPAGSIRRPTATRWPSGSADLWQRLEIRNDDFIRTTEPRHKAVVQEFAERLQRRGRHLRQHLRGLYCVPDERFWTEKDLVDGNLPRCAAGRVASSPSGTTSSACRSTRSGSSGTSRSTRSSSSPRRRRNEVLGFLRKPLEDLCISRPKAASSGGSPCPSIADYVTYVWFDALVNYYSAVDRPEARPTAPWWPADLHLIGKDILTTHAVYWPTMLHERGSAAAADDPRPRLVAHRRHEDGQVARQRRASRSTWPRATATTPSATS